MGTSMMKAITYSEFGISTDVLKLKELPIPKAGNGEVQVSLQFSGSNPSDAKSRAGNRPGVTKPQFEQIIPLRLFQQGALTAHIHLSDQANL